MQVHSYEIALQQQRGQIELLPPLQCIPVRSRCVGGVCGAARPNGLLQEFRQLSLVRVSGHTLWSKHSVRKKKRKLTASQHLNMGLLNAGVMLLPLYISHWSSGIGQRIDDIYVYIHIHSSILRLDFLYVD